ncbi:MAG: gloA [Micavibrio sp.]|nr:gloA [Micavibrio sp.]
MIDHIGLNASDFERSKAFYTAALAPLGYTKLMEFPGGDGSEKVAGFGIAPKTDFWIGEGPANAPHVHVAFTAKTRAEVDAFYAAAMAAGGRDNGAPGLRPQYHEYYYGAFVLDPDGQNVEAVCHAP